MPVLNLQAQDFRPESIPLTLWRVRALMLYPADQERRHGVVEAVWADMMVRRCMRHNVSPSPETASRMRQAPAIKDVAAHIETMKVRDSNGRSDPGLHHGNIAGAVVLVPLQKYLSDGQLVGSGVAIQMLHLALSSRALRGASERWLKEIWAKSGFRSVAHLWAAAALLHDSPEGDAAALAEMKAELRMDEGALSERLTERFVWQGSLQAPEPILLAQHLALAESIRTWGERHHGKQDAQGNLLKSEESWRVPLPAGVVDFDDPDAPLSQFSIVLTQADAPAP